MFSFFSHLGEGDVSLVADEAAVLCLVAGVGDHELVPHPHLSTIIKLVFSSFLSCVWLTHLVPLARPPLGEDRDGGSDGALVGRVLDVLAHPLEGLIQIGHVPRHKHSFIGKVAFYNIVFGKTPLSILSQHSTAIAGKATTVSTFQ